MKTYIWNITIRLFHWLLAIGFTIAYLTSEEESYQNWHFAFGALAGMLILFRVVYGLIGPKYAHFRDFSLNLNSLKEYLSKKKSYAGHNPLAAIVMVGILIVGFLTALSGYALYRHESGNPIGFSENFLEEGHEILANLFLILVILHLIGLAVDFIFKRKDKTIFSIFTGYKNVEGENTSSNLSHILFAVLWFGLSFGAFYWAYKLPIEEKNGTEQHQNEYEDDEEDDD